MKAKDVGVFGVLITILVSLLSFLLLNLNILDMGAGFGRHAFLVTTTVEDNKNFQTFLKKNNHKNVDISVQALSEDYSLIEFEGLGDMNVILKDFQMEVANVDMIEMDTFGSITHVNQTVNNMQLYFIVFFLLFVSVWTYRYRLLGLISSVTLSLFMLVPLFVGNLFYFLFNHQSWYIFIGVFVILTHLKLWSINAIIDNREVDLIVQKTFIISILMSALGFVFWHLNPVYASAGVHLLIISVLLMLDTLILKLFLPRFIKQIYHHPKLERFFEKRSGISVPFIIKDSFFLLMMTGAILLTSFLLTMTQKDVNPISDDFSDQFYLVVDQDDAPSFLEVHASLGKYGLTNNMLKYDISEENKTWYTFDNEAKLKKLMMASEDIDEKLSTKSRVYATVDKGENFINNFFKLLLFGFIILVGLILFLIEDLKKSILFLTLSISSLIFFLLYTFLFKVPMSYEFISSIWFIVAYALGIAVLYPRILNEKMIIKFISDNLSIVVLVFLPIILFVLGVNAYVDRLVQLSFVILWSLLSSLVTLFYIKRIVNYD